MFELNKTAFAEFLCQERKAKGYTQKKLAEKLFVSDKAVSKWERGLSMPDISLLMPLADILGVSVTELLEARRLDTASDMELSQVEVLVKKALTFSEETPEKRKEQRKKHAVLFGGCTLLSLLELLLGIWFLSGRKSILYPFPTTFLTFELLSFIFGVYFWFFMKNRLPAYYDENEISGISYGFFRMNVPGLYFNNSNWPHIVRALRIWSLVTLLTIPPFYICCTAAASSLSVNLFLQSILLVVYLAGLFVPVYVVGRKYG